MKTRDAEGAPFAKAYGAELCDGRLSSGARDLLHYIRLRAWDGKTFMGWKRFSLEMGVSLRTIERRVRELKALGFLTSVGRGFKRSRNKYLTEPGEIYPSEILSGWS